jgi:hypothetical protein
MASPPPLLRRTAALAALLATCATVAWANPFAARDRRVVDLVAAGSALSEAQHGYAGHDDTAGTADGRTYRQARGWMRYAVTTFDDTEVTIACTFLGSASGSFDLIVEDSVIATKHVDVTTGTPIIVELLVPFAVTKGKTSIAVILRAHRGPTPRLHELRTIQDHNEVPLPSGVSR